MENTVKELINEEINPKLALHNGGCELVSLENTVATIRLKGGCKGCPGRQSTFLNGIKPFLLSNVEGLTDVKLSI